MRNHSIVLAALIAFPCWLGWALGLANGAEQLPPTPHAPKSNGTTSGAAAPETRVGTPGAPVAAPAGIATPAEPAQATDVPPSENDGALVAADLQLLKTLHEDNQNAIEMGKLAQEKGAMAQTKAFGRKLVADHAAADRRIGTYLKRKKLDMSILVAVKTSDPPENDLGAKTGNDFDRAFSALIVDGHSKAIEGVKERRDKTTDPGLRSLLAASLPTLRQQVKSARSIADRSNAKI